MRTIDVVEGITFELGGQDARHLRTAVERLDAQLRPSFRLLSEERGRFRLSNVVGTIDVGAGAIVQVSPKISNESDWGAAVVSLLSGDERIEPGGERAAGTSRAHTNLVDAIADAYAKRLERAYRQDGPILSMERNHLVSPSLRGKLHVSEWVRSAAWRPHLFPVTRTEISHDNPYSRLLVEVAGALQGRVKSTRIRLRLATVARDLSLGSVAHGTGIVPQVRQLPSQWGGYKPAWSLALAILSKTSLFGPSGHHTGMSLAVEAWPLLETLLDRTLAEVAACGRQVGRSFHHTMQGGVDLLRPRRGDKSLSFRPKPDGRLYEDNKLIACFEAKYASFNGTMPDRDHIYQAVTTAAACRAPVSVIVYPGHGAPMAWELNLPDGSPTHLLVLNLEMFKWPRPQGGAEVLKALAGVHADESLKRVAVA